jgi:outer membrane immunogenic protein
MKKFLLGSVALAAMVAGPAMAADMPLKAPPPVVYYNWSGCYVGGHVGGKSSRADLTYGNTLGLGFPGSPIVPVAGAAVTDGSIYMSGALAGGQVGCQYEFAGGWLIGVEGDGSWTQSDGQGRVLAGTPFGPGGIAFGPGNLRAQVTEHWMATARAKLGYAWDKWMFYVTGGGAWAAVRTSVWGNQFVAGGLFGVAPEQEQTLSGWTAGFGAEYALGYGWSIKGEYLYMDFSRQTYFGTNIPPIFSEYNLHLRQSVARFGLNYKFDWGYGPVVAKY